VRDAGRVAAIYSTQLRRTLATAAPLATAAGIAVTERPANATNAASYAQDLAREILSRHAGRRWWWSATATRSRHRGRAERRPGPRPHRSRLRRPVPRRHPAHRARRAWSGDASAPEGPHPRSSPRCPSPKLRGGARAWIHALRRDLVRARFFAPVSAAPPPPRFTPTGRRGGPACPPTLSLPRPTPSHTNLFVGAAPPGCPCPPHSPRPWVPFAPSAVHPADTGPPHPPLVQRRAAVHLVSPTNAGPLTQPSGARDEAGDVRCGRGARVGALPRAEWSTWERLRRTCCR
jgi:hypothetical protein